MFVTAARHVRSTRPYKARPKAVKHRKTRKAADIAARTRLCVNYDVVLEDEAALQQWHQRQLDGGGVAPRVGHQPRLLHRGALQLRQTVHRLLLKLHRGMVVLVPVRGDDIRVSCTVVSGKTNVVPCCQRQHCYVRTQPPAPPVMC